MSEPTQRRGGYPGRDDLNAASDGFRRHVAKLHREGVRHKDPASSAKAAELVAEAVETLNRLAGAAMQAAGNSARHRAGAEAEAEKLRQIARKAGPAGQRVTDLLSERAARRPLLPRDGR